MHYNYIIFDFDGVLVDSNAIRINGFKELFRDYSKQQVEELINFAATRGGVSRYDKIKYFFEVVLAQRLSESEINNFAQKYSVLVKQRVIESKWVPGTLEFLQTHHDFYQFALVSGSDENELKEICVARGISGFFNIILGSPKSKDSNIEFLFKETEWSKKASVFIGDCLEDLAAARLAGVDFIARKSGLINWDKIKDITSIADLTELPFVLNKEF